MRTEAGDVKEPRVEAGPPSEHSQAQRKQEEADQRLHRRVGSQSKGESGLADNILDNIYNPIQNS